MLLTRTGKQDERFRQQINKGAVWERLLTNSGKGWVNSFPDGSDGKESACNAASLGWDDPLKKEMATHSSILAWRIAWTEESGGLQYWVTKNQT